MKVPVWVLMTQWKDDTPEISGVFSSPAKAAKYFILTGLDDIVGMVGKADGTIRRDSAFAELVIRVAARLMCGYEGDDADDCDGLADTADMSPFGMPGVRAWLQEETLELNLPGRKATGEEDEDGEDEDENKGEDKKER